MDKVVDKTLKLGYYYYSLVKICGILWLAKQILFFILVINTDISLPNSVASLSNVPPCSIRRKIPFVVVNFIPLHR